ncbi:MAG: hypothetical protein Kow00121_47510 [Elainellaceae cyanobacterium]
MKLQNKVLLVLGVGLVGLSASFYVASRILLTRSYSELENRQVNQDVERVLDAISKDLETISGQAGDYGQWDETYSFITNENKDYIENNIFILNIRLNAILFVNSAAKVVFAQGADLTQEKEIPVSGAFLEQISPSNLLLNHPDPTSKRSGIIQLPEAPMLVASQPILNSAKQGPIRGTLIMGRYIDESYIDQLEELTKLPNITIEQFNSDQLPADFQTARQALAEGASIFIAPLNQDTVAGYAVLRDIAGEPTLLLRVVEPRVIYAQGQASLNYLIVAILIMGAVFSSIIVVLLKRSVLSRLGYLSDSVNRIGTNGLSGERVTLSGQDELSDLASTFNSVLDQLQQSQKALQHNAEQLQRQNNIIAELSHDNALVQGNVLHAARHFLEATATTLGVDRASVWLYSPDRSRLICLDLYERTSDQHSSGLELHATEFPTYFAALFQNAPILVEDIATDARTLELEHSYLMLHKVCSLIDLPIQIAGRSVGIVRCEQIGTRRQWKPEEQTFIYSIANLVSLALESETLQKEVGHLLEVVACVGDGDLTVQAQVSDRLPGLVADTFNRLLEKLSQVLNQVLDAAHQVSAGVNQQQQLAATVAKNAQQQAEAVTQVLHLTEQVEHAAQDSAEQVNSASTSLRTVAATVAQGQDAIASMTQGIQILQEGSDRITQQMKTLGEFVGLTDQFVQDQGQIAFITQTLAMNAALVAAKASEQSDPRQFVTIAREFDSIAEQIAKVAQQTNEGRVILEKQSMQIHRVVSAIDEDVQSLGELVRGFTQGVDQSNQVFNNVQAITGEAVQAGETVAQISQGIVTAAQSTANVMRDIAQIAAKTAELTEVSRQQSDRIDLLAAQLLQNVQFFQLPAANVEQTTQERVDLSEASAVTIDLAPESELLKNGWLEALQAEDAQLSTGA